MSTDGLDEHASDKQHLLHAEDTGHTIHRTTYHRDGHHKWTTLQTILLCSTIILTILSSGLAIALYTIVHNEPSYQQNYSQIPPSPSLHPFQPDQHPANHLSVPSASRNRHIHTQPPLLRPLHTRERPRMGGHDASKPFPTPNHATL